MTLNESFQAAIDPECPLSTWVMDNMLSADLTNVPDCDEKDPEYINKLHHFRTEFIDGTHMFPANLTNSQMLIMSGLYSIAWVMFSTHVNHTVSYSDVYKALCDYEKTQTNMLKIDDEHISEEIYDPANIPDLLRSVPFESLEVHRGAGDSNYVTLENVRSALENCLQDYCYDHIVTIKEDLFLIEPTGEVIS